LFNFSTVLFTIQEREEAEEESTKYKMKRKKVEKEVSRRKGASERKEGIA